MYASDEVAAHRQHMLSVCATGPLSTLESLLSSTSTSHLPSTESMAQAAIASRQPSILQHFLENPSLAPVSGKRSLIIATIKTGDILLFDILLSTRFATTNNELGYMGSPVLYATQLKHPLVYLSALFERGANPDIGVMGCDTWPGLAVAVTCGDEEVVRLYLTHGATIVGSRALWEAAGRGKFAVVKVLVSEAKADVNEQIEGDRFDVLSSSIRAEGVGTALHEAARGGHEDVVKFLLMNGARKDIRDTNKRTAEEVAQACDRPEFGKIIRLFHD